MEIKASDVKALREKTGAGMMECKKALTETNGDAEAAVKLLKEKGLAAVEKRSDRATSEGRMFIKKQEGKIYVCELTCETDFVAKNEDFIALGSAIIDTACAKGYTSVHDDLSAMLLELATKIRENMSLRRLEVIDIPENAAAASYVHSDGKTGAVIVITADPASAKDSPVLNEFAYDCCLHLAAFTPAYVSSADVDAAYIAEQTEIFNNQVAEKEKNKSAEIRANIVKGKIKKHLADICFLDQAFVKDDKLSVSQKRDSVAKEVKAALSFAAVKLFQLGA